MLLAVKLVTITLSPTAISCQKRQFEALIEVPVAYVMGLHKHALSRSDVLCQVLLGPPPGEGPAQSTRQNQ